MPWVRIDDHFPDHPKVDQAGPLAGWLYVCALAYSNRNLTDGFISDSALPRLAALSSPKKHAAALVDAGLWRRVEGGYCVHDYLKFQKARDVILKEREQAARRQAKFRSGHARSNGVTDAGSSASPLPHPPSDPVEIPTSSLEAERDAALPPAEAVAAARRARSGLHAVPVGTTDTTEGEVAS